jgi:IS5 family transposase
MRQQTFAGSAFEQYRKPTRREQFLAEMDRVVPWRNLCALIEPVSPQAGNGRPPVGVERMLRLYFLQQWFNLSDPGVEEALYESVSMCRFVGIDLGREPVPDETTICKFRHLLEAHALGPPLFAAVSQQLAAQGLGISRGTIVDATIISAPASTKNQAHARDPEMRSTKKGNQWYFGMKAHVGVDSRTKLIHSVVATAASVHDSQGLPDRAYAGQRPAIAAAAPQARDLTHRKGYRHRPLSERDAARNRLKSQVRAKVEHPIGVIKRIFGFTKVRYRGLAKNTHRLWVTCALANLFMARRILLRST